MSAQPTHARPSPPDPGKGPGFPVFVFLQVELFPMFRVGYASGSIVTL